MSNIRDLLIGKLDPNQIECIRCGKYKPKSEASFSACTECKTMISNFYRTYKQLYPNLSDEHVHQMAMDSADEKNEQDQTTD